MRTELHGAWNSYCKRSIHGRMICKAIIVGASCGIVFLVCIIVLVSLWRRRSNQKNHPFPPYKRSSLVCFKYKDLYSATKDFNQSKLEKSDGIYKGKLKKDGSMLAIKVVSNYSREELPKLLSELYMIGQSIHKFLVRIRGWCYDKGNLMVVYEYMPKSLDKVLFEEGESNVLSWNQRFKIVENIAEALAFLHHGGKQPIVHRNVKASNVLLDENLLSKLGDFGLTKVFNRTIGYIAPELSMTIRANEKTDVYSFGILVLEIACGRQVINANLSVLELIWSLHQNGRLTDAVDIKIRGFYDKEEVKLVFNLGLLCCHPYPERRPSMENCCQILNGSLALPQLPTTRPQFSLLQQYGELLPPIKEEDVDDPLFSVV